jgi:di/tricarboxylate transporter
MSSQVVSILVLVAIFLVATVWPINMGVLGLVAAFVVGTLVGVTEAEILAGFPGDLFVILVGVTYLFAIATRNGTVDWLVQAAVRSVGGRTAAMPWVMFLVTTALTAVGAVPPAAVAVVAPIGLGFAAAYEINPVLMGLLIVNGACAGGFSPIGIFGSIVNAVVERNQLEASPLLLFIASFVFNVVISGIAFFIFGGRELLRRPVARGAFGSASGTAAVGNDRTMPSLDRDKVLTLIGIGALAATGLLFEVGMGFVALGIAAVLSLLSPKLSKEATAKVAWPTVLLICGVVTYVSLLKRMGTIDWLGGQVATIGAPLLAALLICYIGGGVSAFASTTGILGALIPLAVPFLRSGSVGAVGLITALSISSSVVDASPFSTSGALVVANAPDDQRDLVFRRLMQWGFGMVALAPLVAWAALVVPGWWSR